MTHPSHAYFILFREEGLPSGIFLSGGRLTTFPELERLTRLNKFRPFVKLRFNELANFFEIKFFFIFGKCFI